jgi:hypothetical protein
MHEMRLERPAEVLAHAGGTRLAVQREVVRLRSRVFDDEAGLDTAWRAVPVQNDARVRERDVDVEAKARRGRQRARLRGRADSIASTIRERGDIETSFACRRRSRIAGIHLD